MIIVLLKYVFFVLFEVHYKKFIIFIINIEIQGNNNKEMLLNAGSIKKRFGGVFVKDFLAPAYYSDFLCCSSDCVHPLFRLASFRFSLR